MKLPGCLTSSRSLLLCLAMAVLCSACATAPERTLGPQAVAAEQLLRKADRAEAGHAIGLYLDAARSGLALAADPNAAPAARARGEAIYNAAMAEGAVVMKKQKALPQAGRLATFAGAATTYRLKVATANGSTLENPDTYGKLLDAAKIFRRHLKENTVREGIGGALVGIINSPENVPHRMLAGFAVPMTAVADFSRPDKQGVTPVNLSFLNPRTVEKVTLDGKTFPVKGDFTAPIAYFPRTNPILFGFVAMMRSDRSVKREGIYFLEPYDSRKIPVLFIHGLMSSPHAFLNFINNLERDPDFRRRYQPMVLFYPSGGPIAGNALRLRMQLAELAKQYPLKRNMVLVGHSMGGLLTKMQVTNTGQTLWKEIFGKRANDVSAKFAEGSIVKKALVFQANPHIARVIFIATPHRGSRLADLRISSIAGSLIRMPAKIVQEFNPQMRSMLQEINPSLRRIPSSIVGLSPRSQMLKGMNRLTITVPYHSIIGNQGKDGLPLAETSDGIVPYWSSHLDGAQSEIIVPTGHDAFDNPRSVTEVLRILALQK